LLKDKMRHHTLKKVFPELPALPDTLELSEATSWSTEKPPSLNASARKLATAPRSLE
jgi:hypothetical protein